MELPYTICFCRYQQHIVMLHRTYPPNAQLWNGLGGKIESGETPLASIQREIQEEAGINLLEAPSLFFAGITTWGPTNHDPLKGMYAYIAHLSQQQAEQIHPLNTPEGLITWKPLAWVCNPNNPAVVSNIPHFLPPILQAKSPYEYFYAYENETSPTESFQQLIIRPLSPHIILSQCQGW
jgi:8-oxo-dGTP diphosphatase